MDFKSYYLRLSQDERKAFAEKVGTSLGYCHQLAYGTKKIELGLADAIVAASERALRLKDLPLTKRAKFQEKARKWDGEERRAPDVVHGTANNKPTNPRREGPSNPTGGKPSNRRGK